MQTQVWMAVSGVRAAGVSVAAVLWMAPAGAATLIDFDEVAAPCSWSEGVVALRDEYVALGVSFGGRAEHDGGGVIDECGGFSVSGHSPPNFLGFNRTSGRFNDGGFPAPPETMTFDPPVSRVSLLSGSSDTSSAWIEAYDSGGVLVDSDVIVMSSAVQPLIVSGVNIATVVFDTDADIFVIDDLMFGDPPMLEMTGTCPGPVLVGLRDFQPGGKVGLFTGTALGGDVLPGGPCVGVSTGLTGLDRVVKLRVDNQGDRVIEPDVGASYCQDWFQALDLSTCLLTPVVQMP